MKRVIPLSTLFFLSTLGTAAAQSDDRPVLFKDVTEIDMGGARVEGTVAKPETSLVAETRRPQFNPMIKLRKDFDSEMDQSIEEVR